MHALSHGGEIPPYCFCPSTTNVCTPGLVMSIPRPAGTTICAPSRKTSRCEWTWYCSRSAVSGVSPAARASAIGSPGAAHITALGGLDELGLGAGTAFDE